MMSLPSPGRVLVLLIRLRLRRLFNSLVGAQWRRPGAREKARSGTAARAHMSPIVGVAGVVVMVLAMGFQVYLSVASLHKHLDGPQVSAQLSDPMLRALALATLLLVLTSVFLDVGARELAKPEWDMEWLVTLPVGMGTLLWARLFERSVVSFFGLVAFWPLGTVLSWSVGHGLWAPLVGMLFSLPLMLLSALGRTLLDIGLRPLLSPARLRNLQAVLSLAGLLLLYLVLSATSGQGGLLVQLGRGYPQWATYGPAGLVLHALNASTWVQGLTWWGGAMLQVAALLVLAMLFMRRVLRHGLLAAGTRGAERGAILAATDAASAVGLRQRWWYRLGPVQRRELQLLGRDRNFMVQTLLLPVVIVVGQALVNKDLAGLMAQLLGHNSALIASFAFGLAAYMLLMSALQTLHNEGQTLWLLYTFPQDVRHVLRDKARLWAALALIYPTLIYLAAWLYTPGRDLEFAAHALLAMVGVVIYAVIAQALGVFSYDPSAQETARRVRPTTMYLFMLLAGIYISAFHVKHWWQSLELVLLSALLAMALWQKAAERLPYLLDPSSAPPARVSTADGMVAAMMFLVIQIAFAALFHATTAWPQVVQMVTAFCASGALVYVLVRFTYWRSHTDGVPALWAGMTWRDASLAVGGGFLAGALALGYLGATRWLGLDYGQGLRSLSASEALWFVVLTGLAAPLFEEFIFRGLIYAGLRRMLSPIAAAAASAAVFALVHPPESVLPVFALGLCTAWVYERSKALVAPMLVHAVYNALVLLAQRQGL